MINILIFCPIYSSVSKIHLSKYFSKWKNGCMVIHNSQVTQLASSGFGFVSATNANLGKR